MATLDELYSEAIREAYTSAPSTEPVLGTLELRHPAFLDEEGNPLSAVRIVLDNQDHTLRMETDAPADPNDLVVFKGCPIEVTLPPQSAGFVPEAELAIDNVSRLMMPQIKRATQTNNQIEVSYREYLPSRGDTGAEFTIHGFTAKRASATPTRVTARIGFFDLTTAPFPTEQYTVEDYRGLGPR